MTPPSFLWWMQCHRMKEDAEASVSTASTQEEDRRVWEACPATGLTPAVFVQVLWESWYEVWPRKEEPDLLLDWTWTNCGHGQWADISHCCYGKIPILQSSGEERVPKHLSPWRPNSSEEGLKRRLSWMCLCPGGLKPHREVKTLNKIRCRRSSTKPYQTELFERVNRIDKTLLDAPWEK